MDKYNMYYWGFTENTLIKIDNEYIPIKEIIQKVGNFQIAQNLK